MVGWDRGRTEILGMIERRELTQVTAEVELAERLLGTARQHVASARLLAGSDPYLAYAALHDAIRKALSALLQVQGLRATTSGGHPGGPGPVRRVNGRDPAPGRPDSCYAP